jgi:hypothetical protein
MVFKASFELRADISERWAELNPVLKRNEPAYESDTKMMKIGDGVHTWKELSYFKGDLEGYYSYANLIALSKDEILDICK